MKANSNKIIIQLYIEQGIVLFSDRILSVLLK